MGILGGLGRWFRPDPSPAPEAVADLTWVDEFIARVRPYIYVREEDDLLIKRPNQAQKLNPQGTKMLKALVDGESVHGLLDRVGRDPRRVRDVALFVAEVKRFLEGSLDELDLTSFPSCPSFPRSPSRIAAT
jgi:hypothetical protein